MRHAIGTALGLLFGAASVSALPARSFIGTQRFDSEAFIMLAAPLVGLPPGFSPYTLDGMGGFGAILASAMVCDALESPIGAGFVRQSGDGTMAREGSVPSSHAWDFALSIGSAAP